MVVAQIAGSGSTVTCLLLLFSVRRNLCVASEASFTTLMYRRLRCLLPGTFGHSTKGYEIWETGCELCLVWRSKIENSCVQHHLFGCHLQRTGLLQSRDSNSANQFEPMTSVYNTMNHFLRSFIDHVTHTEQNHLTTCIRLCLTVNVCGQTCWFVLSRPTVTWNI